MGILKAIKETRGQFEGKEKAAQYDANVQRAKNVRRIKKEQGK